MKSRVLVRYGFAVAAVSLAYAIRKLLEPVTGIGAPFVLFFGATMVTSLVAGTGPGVCAALLSLALGAFAFVMPAGYSESQAVVQSALFAVDAAVVVYLSFAVSAARRLAEASEARLRNLIELAPEAFFLADLEGRFVDVNQAACRLLGYTRDELIGMPVADTVSPEQRPRLAETRSALMSPGATERGEWSLARRDGSLVPVEVRANIVEGGRWQAFIRDITGRKRVDLEQRFLAEAGAVLASSLDYEQTLTTLGQLVVREIADFCVIDLIEKSDRPRRLKVVTADPALAEAAARLERIRLGSNVPSLVRSVLDTKSPFVIGHLTPESLASFAQSAEHLEVLRALDPRSLMAVPLCIRGQLLGALVLASSQRGRSYDQTDLQFAQAIADRAALAIENGRLYQASVRASRLRDEVLAVVAHDLRNPLALVLMQAKALERRGEPERRSQRPKELILRAAHRMNRLIQDLLDVSLIEAGQLGVRAAPTSAREIVLDTVEVQRPVAASASIEIGLDWPSTLPEVWADPDRLARVFENLLGNAVKFTPAGGRIVVGATPAEREVVFWVADNGVGIGEDELAHVFDRFWRTSEMDRRGAGLGLAITRGIVEAHGGRIWVESAPGEGSTFFFTIPIAAGSDAHEPAPAP